MFQAPLYPHILQSPAQRPPSAEPVDLPASWLPLHRTHANPPAHETMCCLCMGPWAKELGLRSLCGGRGRVGHLKTTRLVAGPGRVAGRAEAAAGPSWAAAETQTGGTSRHKSRPGDFWAGKLLLRGGWTTGRVGMLRAREECRPHPRPETPARLPEVGTTRWPLLASGRQPFLGSQGGCRERGIPGAGVVVVGCPPVSFPHPSSPAFNSSQPAW